MLQVLGGPVCELHRRCRQRVTDGKPKEVYHRSVKPTRGTLEVEMVRELSLRPSGLRASGSRLLPGNIPYLALSAGLFLLAGAGWGVYLQARISGTRAQSEFQLEVRRLTHEVSRLSADRDRAQEQQVRLGAELEASRSEGAAAQKAISRLVTALENSRAELSVARTAIGFARGEVSGPPAASRSRALNPVR